MDRPDLYVRKMILNEFLSWCRRSWRLVPAAALRIELRRQQPAVPGQAGEDS